MGPETPATVARFEQVSTATPMAAPPLTANLSTPVWSSQKERTPVVWYVDGHDDQNDRHNDQQFDKRETLLLLHAFSLIKEYGARAPIPAANWGPMLS